MSSSPVQTPRPWVRLLGGFGLLALVVFPWLYDLVPLAVKLDMLILAMFASPFHMAGLAFAALYLGILIHEAGHWFFGRLVGIRISDFVVGAGAHPWRFVWRGVRFSFGPWPLWGYVTPISTRANLRFGKRLVFISGGVLSQGMLLLAVWWTGGGLFENAWGMFRVFFFAFGGVSVVGSAWPHWVTIENRSMPNDALLLQQAWKKRGREDEEWATMEAINHVNALAQAGQHAESAAALEELFRKEPNHTDWLPPLARLYTAAKNWNRAFQILDEAIKQAPPDSEARVWAVDHAATLALELGRRDELVRLRPFVEQAFKTAPLPTVAGTLGAVLIEVGETDAGVELLNRCVRETAADHDRSIANAYLAKAALRLGRRERAKELLGFAKRKGGDHALVRRLVAELEPEIGADQSDGARESAAT